MKRQFCTACLATTDNYTTVAYPVNRRFHFCMKPDCQARYRIQVNTFPPQAHDAIDRGAAF